MIKNPQTKATYLAAHSNKLQNIANFGCLAMCYLYCCGIDGTEIDYILNVAKAIDEELLAPDCTVLDADKFILAFTGRKATVVKKNADIKTVKSIEAATPVRYDYNGKSHWVVVEHGQIVFNSLINSICVTKGKPTSARVIKWS